MSIILGINAYHPDSAACVLRDGKIIAAAEEERFTRIKHWAGFPASAIRYCLGAANASLHDVEIVAVNHHPGKALARRIRYLAAHPSAWALAAQKVKQKVTRPGIAESLQLMAGTAPLRARIEHVEHHRAHLAAGWYTSEFNDSVLLSVDGFGDFASSLSGYADTSGLHITGRVDFPHSLGIFYQALTQYLGFNNYGDEYKVMGLASYGQPKFGREMSALVIPTQSGGYVLAMEYFTHASRMVECHEDNGEPQYVRLFSDGLIDILGRPRIAGRSLDTRHQDIASSVQFRYEQIYNWLLKSAHERHPSRNVCVAGGCAMNSVANGKIAATTAFERIHVQPAAGDAGGALGAALVAHHRRLGIWPLRRRSRVRLSAPSNTVSFTPYLGPGFSDDEIQRALRQAEGIGDSEQFARRQFDDDDSLTHWVATQIAAGDVVGWFQGRMEWGPRALGNRSILADPRNANFQDLINQKIKRRESFRPFAPSVLRAHVARWFETDDDVPYMMKVFGVQRDKRDLIPAVVHVDGSGRLHTVERASNPLFYQLIDAFFRITGVPMLLNTSFNENEPVVCTPSQALDCFLRTQMDTLILGKHVVRRRNAAAGVVTLGQGIENAPATMRTAVG